jgi:hypothetical protein
MVNQDVFLKLADAVCRQMDQDRLAYMTKTRLEMATLLRQVSGQPRSKIGRNVGDAIEAALEHRGFRAFPHINDVGPHEAVRIIRRGTFVDQILNAFLHPGVTTDTQLAELITKVKQQDQLLKWSKTHAPASS